MHQPPAAKAPVYTLTPALFIAGAAALLLLAAAFHAPVAVMAEAWFGSEEYSHAGMIPLVAAFLIWQRRALLEREAFTGSWAGCGLALAGCALHLLGQLSTLYIIQQYALLVVLYGLVLALTGWKAFRTIAVPLLILAFMIPLPQFLYANLSSELQLLSSQIGVAIIRLFDISVFLEGNVIDLGVYKLQVVEACNGLRYLFPLMALGFILAYFYQAAFWKRAVIFLSSVPITILMNSLRIGMIGVLVEYRGIAMAEGFLHEFQGWAIFMLSTLVLFVEMMLLARIGRDRRPWRELYGLESPAPPPADAPRVARALPASLAAALVLVAVTAAITFVLPDRVEHVPARASFVEFPMQVDGREGRRQVLEPVYLDALKLDDYLLADYRDGSDAPINFYVAWYASQRQGQAAHSPRSCIPGGGWQIVDFGAVDIDGAGADGGALRLNRVLVQYGDQQQLVYYWFQQRGRVITSEYRVKWELFRDSLLRSRSDGALVRLTMPVRRGDVEAADRKLRSFAAAVAPRLPAYVPD